MKVVRIIALLLLAAFVGIQFMPTKRNLGAVVPTTDFLKVTKAPKNIGLLIQKSCYDCHSNNTKYPWYSAIQPAAWFMENHIKDGKSELNFSKWENYSNRRKNTKLEGIINQIKEDKMPLGSYVLLHKQAKFSDSEKKEMIRYMIQLKNQMSKL